MDSVIAISLLCGLIFGTLYRTYEPYRTKVIQGKVQRFDTKYFWSAMAAFIGATLTAMTMFNDAAQSWSEGWPFGTGYAAVFVFGFLWSVGWNHGANRILIDGRR